MGFNRNTNSMNNNSNSDSEPKATPIVGLAFEHYEKDDEVKTRLLVDEADVEVEISPLSAKEQKLREECEEQIREGLLTVNLVGWRLHQIKSQKLFRSTHRSFEQYCLDVWGISRVHANRKTEAYRTQELLKLEPKGTVAVPQKETHSRAMAGCTDEEKKKIARKVKENVGDGKPTAQDWADAKAEVAPDKAKPASKGKGKKSKAPAVEPDDETEDATEYDSADEPAAEFLSLTELSEMFGTLHDLILKETKNKEIKKLAGTIRLELSRYAEAEEPALDMAA